MLSKPFQHLVCLRDRAMVAIAQYLLAKIDRVFVLYNRVFVCMALITVALACLGLMGAPSMATSHTSIFGLPTKLHLGIALLSPLPATLWLFFAQPWMLQGSRETDDQRETLNQIAAHYGLVQRNHYKRAEAWLINNYLAPAQRIEQAARQLECSTKPAVFQHPPRRL